MLEALERTTSVRAAAGELAERYAHAPDTIERDVCELCEALRERGLIEVDAQNGA